MSRKRRNTSSPEASPPPIRRKQSSPVFRSDSDDPADEDELPRVNQDFGQTGAFPGLGSNDSDELFYGPARNGIEYLRMVRSEARGVPMLLTALDKTDMTQAEVDENSGGYWEDDTFIAAPSIPAVSCQQHPAAQTRYYECLLAQFRVLQATLRCTPPLSAIKGLHASHLISFPSNSSKAQAQWRHQVRNKDPNMVQMACLDEESLWALLGLLQECLDDGSNTPQRLGAWLWAALAKCPAPGEMVSEDICMLRDLARTAVARLEALMMKKDFHQQHRIHLVQDGPMDGDNGIEAPSAALEHMILDMIITVVGEVYGQRDLLAKRAVWQISTT